MTVVALTLAPNAVGAEVDPGETNAATGAYGWARIPAGRGFDGVCATTVAAGPNDALVMGGSLSEGASGVGGRLWSYPTGTDWAIETVTNRRGRSIGTRRWTPRASVGSGDGLVVVGQANDSDGRTFGGPLVLRQADRGWQAGRAGLSDSTLVYDVTATGDGLRGVGLAFPERDPRPIAIARTDGRRWAERRVDGPQGAGLDIAVGSDGTIVISGVVRTEEPAPAMEP